MDAKSKLLLELVRRLPQGLPPPRRQRPSASANKRSNQADSVEVIALKEKLQTLRAQLLEASRRNDFRAEARLKAKLAEINKSILEAQHLPVLSAE